MKRNAGALLYKSLKLFFLITAVFFIFACSSEYNIIPQNSNQLVKLHEYQPYVIGCGDMLRVVVWGHDDLSVNAVVMPDGKVSLPLVGDIHAEGLSVEALKKELNKKMSEYILEPAVSVSVSQIKSMKIYIIGEVNRPGEYDLVSYTDVLQAVAKAGGFTIYAKKSKVQVIRDDGNRRMKIKFDYNQVVKGKNLDQNIPLKPGDVIIVP